MLQQTLGYCVAVNYVNNDKFSQRCCYKCGKPGHVENQCRKLNNLNNRSHFNKRKNLQVTINGDANKKNNANGQANLAKTEDDPDKDKAAIQCYICHAQGDHDSFDCLNGTVTVRLKNLNFEEFEKQNTWEDATNPNKKYRVV